MKRILFPLWFITFYLMNTVLWSYSIAYSQETGNEDTQNSTADQTETEVLKPQKICPLTGGAINKEAYTDYKGQRIYFCCMGCEPRFWKNPEKSLQKMKESGEMAETLDPVKIQPKCPVSGEDIDPAMYTDHNGKRIFFFNEKSRKKFNKNPEKFIKKMKSEK